MSHASDVKRYYRAWSEGDLETMLSIAHPEIKATPTLAVLYERSTYVGHDGITAWFHEVARGWEAFEPIVLDLVDDDGTIVAFIELTAARGGRRFSAHIAVLHEFRDDRIVTQHGRDWYEVREELGLPQL